jgi:hypothetical protein
MCGGGVDLDALHVRAVLKYSWNAMRYGSFESMYSIHRGTIRSRPETSGAPAGRSASRIALAG